MISIDNSNKYVNDIFENIKSKFIILILQLLDILKFNSKNFIKFLIDNKILQLAMGIIIGTQVGLFMNQFNNIILKPLIDYIESKNNYINNYTYTIFNINIKYGKLLLSFINLFTSLSIVYLLWCISNVSNHNFNNMFKVQVNVIENNN